jgi:hypothetical protein
MPKSKTHFEQVPLEIVQKIVKGQLERGNPNADEIDRETPKNGIAWPDERSSVEVSSGPTKL